MEAAPAALAGSSSSLPPPETIVPPPPRGQKRGVPDEDDAAGDGAARGSPRRAAGAGAVVEEEEEESSSMEFVEEEEDGDDDDDEPEVFYAPPDRQLLDFLRVHPCAAAATGAGAMAGQAHQEPKPVVDVTLRLGVGPLADADDTEVDTTLSLRLGPAPPPAAAAAAAAMAEDGRRHFLPRGVPASIAALLGAPVPAVAPDAEPAAGSSDDRGGGNEVACRVVLAGPSDQQSLPHFFDVDDYAIDCFAVGYANDGGAAGRPSSSGVMDMNKPCRSGSGSPDDVDGKPDPTMVPDPATAEVGERRRPLMPFDDDDFFCSHVLIDDYT